MIHTDAGITGFAFSLRGAILRDIVDRRIRPELVGRNALDRELIWHRLWELDRIDRFPVYLMSVIDVAIWDISGKFAELPVHALMGTRRRSLPAYASTVTFGSISEYLDVADQCLELGYPAIKLHAWGDAKADAALVGALREHVGPDVDLMYDGSAGFDLLDAEYVGRALSANGYLWYEEPMPEFSVTAYRRLQERVDVPILGCEVAEGSHMASADFIASGAATAVRTSTGLRGGFTGALRIGHLADAFLMRAEVHAPGLESLHLCMAMPRTTYYESLVDSNPVRRPSEVDSGGLVYAPSSPGVGWESHWETVGAPAGVAFLLESA